MTTRSDVGTLEASGLVGLAALEPELEYLFRHVLVQDAAYGSLLKQERRELHRRVAEALLELYPERRRELAAVIGMHLEAAGEAERAAPLLVEAGEDALTRRATREARSLFERARAALAGATDPGAAALRARAGVAAVKAGWTFVPWDEERRLLEDLDRESGRLGDERVEAELHFWSAFLRRAHGERPETSEPLRRAIERLEALGAASADPLSRALPDALLGAGHVFSGDLRRGVDLLEGAARAFDEAGDTLGAGEIYQLLSMAYARLGDFAKTEGYAERAEHLAAEGDPIARLDAKIMRAAIAAERGDLEDAAGLATECAALSEELGATLCAIPSNYFIGESRLRLGQADLAKRGYERMLELDAGAAKALPGLNVLARAGLGASAALLGDVAAGTLDLEAALERARAAGDRFAEATILARRATSRPAGAPPSERDLADLGGAARVLEDIGARPAHARTLAALAAALDQAGRTEEAAAARERSRALARDLGLRDRGLAP